MERGHKGHEWGTKMVSFRAQLCTGRGTGHKGVREGAQGTGMYGKGHRTQRCTKMGTGHKGVRKGAQGKNLGHSCSRRTDVFGEGHTSWAQLFLWTDVYKNGHTGQEWGTAVPVDSCIQSTVGTTGRQHSLEWLCVCVYVCVCVCV